VSGKIVSDKKTTTFNPGARRKARHYGLQALYQWQMTKNALSEIEEQFLTDYDFNNVDGEYFHELVFKVPSCVSELEDAFSEYLQDRTIDELDPIELALLRVGSYELVKRIDIPYKVAINESVSLAKKFGAAESHKYINAVLDKLAQKVRATEVNGTKS
jgi:transcription antitermination protein NusB